MQLEDGEISDSSEEGDINPYTPLERPILHYAQPTRSNANETSTMDEDGSSCVQLKRPSILNSDSESEDEHDNSKRMKLSPRGKNKYTIWNKDPDGDLTDFLNQVGMEEKPAPEDCRNVENYPLPFAKNQDRPNGKQVQYKRRRKIPIRRKCVEPNKDLPKVTRILDSLEVNETNTIEEVAEDITKKLMECNLPLILRIVIVLGKDKAIELYEKTRVVEKLGGMLINNGSRKRTSGGVFIFLVRSDKEVSDDKLEAIFEKDLIEEKKMRKAINKIKKKRKKGRHTKKDKKKTISTELSNPPPSPDLPDLPTRSDVLTELADLGQQKGISQIQENEEDDDDDELISYEDIDFHEIV